MLPNWVTLPFDQYRARRIADHLLRFVTPGESILDCGCGSMLVAQRLKETSGVRIVGTDVINLNRTDLSMCLCPAESLAFASACFDIVILVSVLHHVNDQVEALHECLRVASHRVLILEDVYENAVELLLLKVLDWIGNRQVSSAINLPFRFKSESEWTSLFNALGVRSSATQSVIIIPWRPSRHRLFVLEKPQSEITKADFVVLTDRIPFKVNIEVLN